MSLSIRMKAIALAAVLGGAGLLVAAGNGSGDTPYGFAGPPGGANPDFGWQATTLRADPSDFDRTTVSTHGTKYAPGHPLIDPTGLCLPGGATNLLPTVELNMLDILSREMENTLPSSAADPYNLQEKTGAPGEDAFGVVETPIDSTSPTTDLVRIIRKARHAAEEDKLVDTALLKVGINILEGVDLLTGLTPSEVAQADAELGLLDGTGAVTRRYEGFPLLHYRNGSNGKTKVLTQNAAGQWQATVRQLWYDSHIESDAAFIDVSPALNDEWIVEYQVDVLDDGEDDFAPFVMYFSRGPDPVELAPPNNVPQATLDMAPRAPHVAMDTTFFPMQPGNNYRFRMKHAPGKYYNLSYHWGWRVHPPRVQALENAAKSWPGPVLVDPLSDEFVTNPDGSLALQTKSLRGWELDVFGNPDDPGYDRVAVIDAMIGDLAPAKRMWTALRAALALDGAPGSGNSNSVAKAVAQRLVDAEEALLDWRDRTKLPAGVQPDPDADLTMIYLNNTLYAGWQDERRIQRWFEFQTRSGNEQPHDPDTLQIEQDSMISIALLNGDRYVHGYLNVDFGGGRGWENMFGPTVAVGGSGAWFSFGRVRWWINAGAGPQMDPASGAMGMKDPIFVRPVKRDASGAEIAPGKHLLSMEFNYEPTRRLRMYQFDPMHHDVAVYSLH